MAITFKKRQKEMKRLEKRREKEERRAQKKLAKRAANEASEENAPVPPKPETEGSVPQESASRYVPVGRES